jgi:hypothetical protein
LAAALLLGVSGCASASSPTPAIDASVPRAAIEAANLVPAPTRLAVVLAPGVATAERSFLEPYQDLRVSNESSESLRVAQTLRLVALRGGDWHLVGCTGAGFISVDESCELAASAVAEVGPGETLDANSPLPLFLEWPVDLEAPPGEYAVIVAFGTGDLNQGAGARLHIVP